MSVYDRKKKNGPPVLRWYAGVPLGSNPLIFLDFVSLIAVVFMIGWFVVLAAQFYFDGYVAREHLWGAAVISADLCFLFAVFYAAVCFVALRNRYAAQYRFDENGVLCDNMRCFPRALRWKPVHFRCYPIEEPKDFSKNIARRTAWADVTRVSELPELRVLVLRGKRGTLQRVYCPDEETYAAAREYVRDRTGV